MYYTRFTITAQCHLVVGSWTISHSEAILPELTTGSLIPNQTAALEQL